MEDRKRPAVADLAPSFMVEEQTDSNDSIYSNYDKNNNINMKKSKIDQSICHQKQLSPFQLRKPRNDRRINEEIHKTINLEPTIVELMDTAPMQRLKRIKQLGAADFVYTNANHNRFEHSLGVAHIAERVCKRIKENQPNLKTTAKDVLCVKIAGLMHDIGHGPHSHQYEIYRCQILPRYLDKNPHLKPFYEQFTTKLDDYSDFKTSHEEVALKMIDMSLEQLGLAIDLDNLDKPLKQISDGIDATKFGISEPGQKEEILTSRDFIFVKEAIMSGMPLRECVNKFGKNELVGRPKPEQEFLYDIVANKYSGLDVDKMDYLARDQKRALCNGGEIDHILVEEARVARSDCPNPQKCFRCSSKKDSSANRIRQCDTHYVICYPEKLVPTVMDFFRKRYELHTKVYQHKTSLAAQYMMCDILCLADPYFRVKPKIKYNDDGSLKEALPISLAFQDPSCFLSLHDGIFAQIEAADDPRLDPAKALLNRLLGTRDFYKCAGVMRLDIENSGVDKEIWDKGIDQLERGILNKKWFHQNKFNDNRGTFINRIQPDEFINEKCYIHHGSKSKNPLKHVRFLYKHQIGENLFGPINDLPMAREIDESGFRGSLPSSLHHGSIRIYSRDSNKEKVDLISHVFNQWVEWIRAGGEIILHSTNSDGNGGDIEEQEEVFIPTTNMDGCQEDNNTDNGSAVGAGDNDDAFPLASNLLSQETDDEEDGDDDDQQNVYHGNSDDNNNTTRDAIDQSPIPVSRYHRHNVPTASATTRYVH